MTNPAFKPVFTSGGYLAMKDEVKSGAFFDVWAKRWDAETDEFEWERFTNCCWDWEGSRPKLKGVGTNWRPVYWVAIPVPAEAA